MAKNTDENTPTTDKEDEPAQDYGQCERACPWSAIQTSLKILAYAAVQYFSVNKISAFDDQSVREVPSYMTQ
jgi:hypothetical protein